MQTLRYHLYCRYHVFKIQSKIYYLLILLFSNFGKACNISGVINKELLTSATLIKSTEFLMQSDFTQIFVLVSVYAALKLSKIAGPFQSLCTVTDII